MNNNNFSVPAFGFILGGVLGGLLVGAAIQAQWGDKTSEFLNGIYLAMGVFIAIVAVGVGASVLKERDQ